MIGNPGKTWGAFFGFSASSLQRMHRYQLAVSILVNASPLPSSSIHHQEVPFGTQVAGNWLFHQIPHRTCNIVNDPRDLSSVAACNVVNDPRDLSSVATYNVVNDPRDLSSVATCNVVNDPRDLSSVATCNVVNDPRDLSSVATCNVVNNPRDLSSMAIYHVRSTRNVNMPPHPTPLHPTIAIFKNVRFTGTVFGPQAQLCIYIYETHVGYRPPFHDVQPCWDHDLLPPWTTPRQQLPRIHQLIELFESFLTFNNFGGSPTIGDW